MLAADFLILGRLDRLGLGRGAVEDEAARERAPFGRRGSRGQQASPRPQTTPIVKNLLIMVFLVSLVRPAAFRCSGAEVEGLVGASLRIGWSA